MVEKNSTLSTSEKLIFAYQSRKSFAEALEVAESLNDLPGKKQVYAHIGLNQARLNINPADSLDFLAKFMQTSDEIFAKNGVTNIENEKLGARYNMAEILMEMGEIDTAFDLVSPKVGALHPQLFRFDLRLARKMFYIGRDPQPALDRALVNVGLWGGGDSGKVVLSERLNVPCHADISKTYFDTGGDFRTLLTKTVDLAGKSGDYWACIAEAYAYCDDLESAWQMVTKISEDKRKKKQSIKTEQDQALEKIGLVRLAKEDLEGTRSAVSKIRDKLLFVELAAEAICSQPENNHFPFDEALRYRRRLSRLKKDPAEIAILDSLLGRAAFALGKDSSYFFDQALARASVLDADDRVFAYDGIAENLARSRLDATSIWRLCYEAADEKLAASTSHPGPYRDFVEIAEYGLNMEDITKHQVECGYFDLARETVEKIITVERDELSISIPFKGKIIADIAAKQGVQGLSNVEITDLPHEEIRAILKGINDLAKNAVRYFGLDKIIQF